MVDQRPVGILFDFVKSQVAESSSLGEIESWVHAAAAKGSIPNTVVEELLDRFRAELGTPAAQLAAPRLLVDWGELPRVGHQARPQFSLLCPQYTSRPELHIAVDRDLDHDANDPLRRPQAEEPGLWTFHVPFRMTSEGKDCRPGQYLVDVQLSFRDIPAELPRFYRCRIRLTVPRVSAEEGGVLEIDGDGQSIVNLQGYNLKQFSKVVLKGGQHSVVNLQNLIGENDNNAAPRPEENKPDTTFEYELKVNTELQSRLPAVCCSVNQRSHLDAASLVFEDGSRCLVMTRRHITFGRNRDNDVVLRFLPRSEENDAHSRNISRTHVVVQLTPEGVELQDKSRTGIKLNYSVVRDRAVVPALHAGGVTHIDLGVTGTVPKAFRLEMLMFAPDRYAEREELEFWDELYCELVGSRLSPLTREARDVGLDAIRFDRSENLAGEEAYVLLLREAMIGGSPNQSAILLKESGPKQQARLLHMDRTFWLESLPGAGHVSIDGTPLSPRTLIPLVPGMQIQFGTELVTFDRPVQLHLDSQQADASASEALVIQRAPLINSADMELKLIPAGTFPMGDGPDAHTVTLTQPFYIGVYEVTQEQYQKVMGTNPSQFKGVNNPVEQVSWDDAVEFCGKLSALPEEKSAGRVYRLPTEAEWEYACRAGTTTQFSFREDQRLGMYVWYAKNSNRTTHPVGQKKPNPWGLCDMHGNVYEWCQDWKADYPSGPVIDPRGPSSGSHRVRRGGSWRSGVSYCQSAARYSRKPEYRVSRLGFRVALILPGAGCQ